MPAGVDRASLAWMGSDRCERMIFEWRLIVRCGAGEWGSALDWW